MGCSRASLSGEGVYRINGETTGIIVGHAYGIMDILELDIGDTNIEKHKPRLIRMRNPHGHTEWNGKWSDQFLKESDENGYKNQLDKYIKNLKD